MTEFSVITGFIGKGTDAIEPKINQKLAEEWKLYGPMQYDVANTWWVQCFTREIEVTTPGNGKRAINTAEVS